MINDVVFNDEKSAYKDWNIILTKCEISVPTVKSTTVDIKGSDGVLDLSEVLTGDVKYNNRTAKLTFEMCDDANYYQLISDISNYLHGKKITFILSNDDNYQYVGRASISQWECVKRKGTIVISVDCDPYKYDVTETVITHHLIGMSKSILLPNKRKKVCPVIDVTGNIKMTFRGSEYQLEEGVQQLVNFTLDNGNNLINLDGYGTIKFNYRQGAL